MSFTADPIKHRADCYRHEPYETTGALGDALIRCRSCARFVMLASLSHAAQRRGAQLAAARPVRPVESRVVLDMPRPARVRREGAQRAPEPAPAPAPVAVTLASRYRCGDHPEVPVTWKGTGCPECEHEHAARQRDREHAARARRERAERDRQG